MIQQDDIERAIMRAAYEVYFAGERRGAQISNVGTAIGADPAAVEQAVASLYNQGKIGVAPPADYHWISPRGIDFAERQGIIPTAVAQTHRDARFQLLEYLAQRYEADKLFLGRYIPDTEIAADIGLDPSIVLPNLVYLTDIHLVSMDMDSRRAFCIRDQAAVQALREKQHFLQEFQKLESMSPRERGLAFQKLFTERVGREGDSPQEGVRTSNEELDVVLYRNESCYVVECKWVKKPIERKVIDQVAQKVRNRVDVRGIAVSMSGFTEGAIKQVEDCANQSIAILLFGPEDVRSIFQFEMILNDFRFKQTFTSLLDQKLDALRVQRSVLVN